ncbi:MAG: endonuclease III, partial [Nitrospira sp.]|nr:endonuclease III [Nitrospira sp.]
MNQRNIHTTISILRQSVKQWPTPVVGVVANDSKDPFRILIACLLSLRTQDKTTAQASQRLFSLAGRLEEMSRLPVRVIERAIYPVGFYRTKARTIKLLCRELFNRFKGKVPGDLDTLLTLKGVGRKTANLVMTLGFSKPGICVDTHVHRICNRWGYVKTRTPDETEMVLRDKLPLQYWNILNDLLVPYGQNLCKPI